MANKWKRRAKNAADNNDILFIENQKLKVRIAELKEELGYAQLGNDQRQERIENILDTKVSTVIKKAVRHYFDGLY